MVKDKNNHRTSQTLTRLEKTLVVLGVISLLTFLITIKTDLGMTNSSYGNLIAFLGIYNVIVAIIAVSTLIKVKSTKHRLVTAIFLLTCMFISFMQLLGAAVINT